MSLLVPTHRRGAGYLAVGWTFNFEVLGYIAITCAFGTDKGVCISRRPVPEKATNAAVDDQQSLGPS